MLDCYGYASLICDTTGITTATNNLPITLNCGTSYVTIPTLQSTTATVSGTLTSGTCNATSGTIATLNATTSNVGTATVSGTLTSGTLNSTTSNIATVNATTLGVSGTLTAGTFNASSIYGNTVTVNAGTGLLTAVGTTFYAGGNNGQLYLDPTNGAYLKSTGSKQAKIDSYGYASLTCDTTGITTATNNLPITLNCGTSYVTIPTLQSTTATVSGTLTAGTCNATSGTIATLNATTANVSGTLTSGTCNATTINVSTVNATTLGVSGTLTAGTFNASSIYGNTVTVDAGTGLLTTIGTTFLAQGNNGQLYLDPTNGVYLKSTGSKQVKLDCYGNASLTCNASGITTATNNLPITLNCGTSYVTIPTLQSTTATVSGTLTAGTLNATTLSLSTVNATTLGVSGTLTAGTFNASSIYGNTVTVDAGTGLLTAIGTNFFAQGNNGQIYLDPTNGAYLKATTGKPAKIDSYGYASLTCDTTGIATATNNLPVTLNAGTAAVVLNGGSGQLTVNSSGITSSGTTPNMICTDIKSTTANGCETTTTKITVVTIASDGSLSFNVAMPSRCTAVCSEFFWISATLPSGGTTTYYPWYPPSGSSTVHLDYTGTIYHAFTGLTPYYAFRVAITYQTA